MEVLLRAMQGELQSSYRLTRYSAQTEEKEGTELATNVTYSSGGYKVACHAIFQQYE
jgi:hypothetical protein